MKVLNLLVLKKCTKKQMKLYYNSRNIRKSKGFYTMSKEIQKNK